MQDEQKLRYYLKNISYYHLSIYFKYFQNDDLFYKGVTFEDVLRIYVFDNKLRILLSDLLERVEKSLKCRMTYELSLEKMNSHWHLDADMFVNQSEFENITSMLSEEYAKSKELSLRHYREEYSGPQLPPMWMLVEILSFGQCVKICKALTREYKNKIARTYGDDEQFVLSWMHGLSVLRNNCAHHARLWNRDLVFQPKINHKIYASCFVPETRRLYNYLVVLQVLLREVNPTSSWLDRLDELIREHSINVRHMGFPDDWKQRLESIMSQGNPII